MKSKNHVLLTFAILTLLFLSHAGILLGIVDPSLYKLTVNECLLPKNHPLSWQLDQLFQNKSMFHSRDHFKAAGFHLITGRNNHVMVGSHPYIDGYLFKKFNDSVSQQKQLDNYLKRISGARALQEFIDTNHLKHIVVPQKWLYPLPKIFSDPKTGERTYLLVVEKMDLCSMSDECEGLTKKYEEEIDERVLTELCMVIYNFRGLDSWRKNLPFTTQNQIAFIDTEKWEQHRSGNLRKLYLRPKSKKFTEKIFQLLEYQDKLKKAPR